MPRKATKKVGAGPVKTDDLKVAQSYNPNISDYDSDKEMYLTVTLCPYPHYNGE